MTVNKYFLRIPLNDNQVNIPLQMEWNSVGQEDAIDIFEQNAVKEIIGTAKDFETARFSHKQYQELSTFLPNLLTEINYEFYFHSGSTITLNGLDWAMSYQAAGFLPKDIYYFSNGFSRSFFKLDLYDLPDEKAQTNYITIILPTQQGFTETADINPIGVAVPIPPVQINIPKFKLDFVGDKEGFFIYWLKSREFLDITTFYMTAKFFDARTGQFIKMMTFDQVFIGAFGTNTYNFRSEEFFYYRVQLDYSDYTYQVFDYYNNLRGDQSLPIRWYEYVNP